MKYIDKNIDNIARITTSEFDEIIKDENVVSSSFIYATGETLVIYQDSTEKVFIVEDTKILELRTKNLVIRVTETEKNLLEEKAAVLGLKPSEYYRKLLGIKRW